MNASLPSILALLVLLAAMPSVRSDEPAPKSAKKPDHTVPVFKDGEAQVVDGFKDSDYWIRHDLWVEAEFDSDSDGQLDRMHVSVTRPRQTETEGLRLPVVYVSSPYFAGTGAAGTKYFWEPASGTRRGTPATYQAAAGQTQRDAADYLEVARRPVGTAWLHRRPFVIAGDRLVAGLPHRRRRQRIASAKGGRRLAVRACQRLFDGSTATIASLPPGVPARSV